MSRGGKTARSRATRARVIAAASELFTDAGYHDTTMATIASAAGVSVQTLYLAFGSKADILKAAHDVAVVGDDESVPLLGRSWVHDMRDEPHIAAALSILVEHGARVLAQTSPMYAVIKEASGDSEVAELAAEMRRQRLEFWSGIAGELLQKRHFNPQFAHGQATDVLYAIMGPDLYRVLIFERGWSVEQWRDWTYQTLQTQLILHDTPSRA